MLVKEDSLVLLKWWSALFFVGIKVTCNMEVGMLEGDGEARARGVVARCAKASFSNYF